MTREEDIGDEYFKNDPWMVGFISDCLNLYGCPRNESDCLNREEGVWYMYSYMFLTGMIERLSDERLQSLMVLDTEKAAWEYAKEYEEEYGESLIMPYQGKDEIL